MEPLEIFLLCCAAGLCSIVVIIIAFVVFDYVKRGGQHKCNGKAYDTIDSEEWYAKCGAVAPHSPHLFKQYNEHDRLK